MCIHNIYVAATHVALDNGALNPAYMYIYIYICV